jgi:hypothetical protein
MKSIAILALMLVCPAHAQQAKTEGHGAAEDKARTVRGGASKGVKACHEDIDRFCKDVTPGEGRIGACLKANKKKLSKSCVRWAAHGGKGHSDEALAEIDKSLAPAPPPK